LNEALLTQLGLKSLARQGWVDVGVPQPESVAAHSWGVALLAIHLLPQHLDMAKALSFAVLHDLPEVTTGDFTPRHQISKEEKVQLERRALTNLLQETPRAATVTALFEDYLSQDCEESRFIHQLDKLDMALQAVYYRRTSNVDLLVFIDSAACDIYDPKLQQIVAWCRTQIEGQTT
jgi:putative hydrolase of HD superfamily